MDYDRYFALNTSSRNYQSTPKSQFDFFIDFEDIEEDDEDVKGEYACPFCAEDFDFVGLCCHIDEEHHIEANSGVCPICFAKVGMDMVGHITTEHGNISKSWYRLKLHKGYSHSTILSSRKELQNGHFQSLPAKSSSSVSSSKMVPDPWLLFVNNAPTAEVSDSVESNIGESTKDKSSCKTALETNVQPPSVSDKDHPEKVKKCEFVQGLLWSTIMYDGL